MADLYFCYATLFCGYVCLLLKMKSYQGFRKDYRKITMHIIDFNLLLFVGFKYVIPRVTARF